MNLPASSEPPCSSTQSGRERDTEPAVTRRLGQNTACQTANVPAAATTSSSAHGCAALVALGVVAVGPAAWWVVDGLGGLGAQVAPEDADYAWQPLAISAAVARTVGIVACLLVVAALFVLVAQTRSHRWRAAWWQVAAALAVLFGYAGMLVAVATEPVIGANIGFGLMALGAAPVALGVLVWLVVAARRLRASGARAA